jgi:translation initiation factor IF-2
MTKVRVYSLARELNLETKELIDILTDLGVTVKNHMSTLEDDVATLVAETVREAKELETTSAGSQEANAKRLHVSVTDDAETDFDTLGEAQAAKKRIPKGSTKLVVDDDVFEDDTRIRSSSRKGKKKDSQRTKDRSVSTSKDKKKVIEILESISVRELAGLLDQSPAVVIKELLDVGIVASINQDVDYQAASKIAERFDVEVKKIDSDESDEYDFYDTVDSPEALVSRPPVVTVMGHVDHGKTSLLDAIRKTHVTEREAGGITQHIGAYQVEINGKKIAFIDTPGHEAFTAMRARGAKVTDLAILVVAADDGVMPQTVEAINHAKAANVPIIVAINKIDKPTARPDRVKQELIEHGLVAEDWGGDTVCVPVSALKGEGINELLEMIILVAEMGELKANPNRRARGVIIESQLDVGRGPVATVLVQNGTLHIGDPIVTGSVWGKVRAMTNDKGVRIDSAGPAAPVEVIGFSDMPAAGDILYAVKDDKTARANAEKKAETSRSERLQRRNVVTLDTLFDRLKEGEVSELNVVIKGDVQGSVEAIRQSLEQLSTQEVKVNVVHTGVGGITENDIMLASASNAIIIGFNVRPDSNAKHIAEDEDVDIRLYRIIYDVVNEVRAAMQGLLKPEYKEIVLGRAEVRTLFKVPKVGVIAGSYVTDGRMVRNAEARVLRDSIVVHESRISSLRRFKDDAREVASGFECGIGVENFNDLKEGDVIEAFGFEEIKRVL